MAGDGETMRESWIITKITTKCPKCGREYEDVGKWAQDCLNAASMICADCGFEGDLGL